MCRCKFLSDCTGDQGDCLVAPENRPQAKEALPGAFYTPKHPHHHTRDCHPGVSSVASAVQTLIDAGYSVELSRRSENAPRARN